MTHEQRMLVVLRELLEIAQDEVKNSDSEEHTEIYSLDAKALAWGINRLEEEMDCGGEKI